MLLKRITNEVSSWRSVRRGLASKNNIDLQVVFQQKVASSAISHDERQYRLLKLLTKVNTNVCDYTPEPRRQQLATSTPVLVDQTTSIDAKDAISTSSHKTADETITLVPEPPPRVKGVYIYGHVGVGKTMVMDIFFTHCPIEKKRRVHFHKFMLEIHQRIHNYKQQLLQQYGRDVNINLSSERDAIVQVAHDVADNTRLLCFDEFQVTDICDAMMLSKFFGVLWERGTVLVATSNRPPTDLYNDGLNRKYFLPFIERLTKECILYDMNTAIDYRLKNLALENAYYTPVNDNTTKRLWNDFLAASNADPTAETMVVEIPVMMGRTVAVTVAGSSSGNSSSSSSSSSTNSSNNRRSRVCWVDFKYLCEGDRGASDYQAVCQSFDEIYLSGIPRLSVIKHDRARRFITLIDEIYDAGIRLHWTAETEPSSLFREVTASEVKEKNLGTDHGWSTQSTRNVDMTYITTAGSPRPAISTSCVIGAVETTYRGHSADAAEDQLKLLEGELSSVQELKFAFRRAASRMTEMSGTEYANR